jgi:uncharacterized Zn-binding protein involved in type VI secretion
VKTRRGLLGLIFLTSVALGGISGRSDADAVPPPDPSAILGWTGSDPRPLAVSIGHDGGFTAAFTTDVVGGQDLWVADSGDGTRWTVTRIADHVVSASAAFAVNGTGAAIAGWDTAAGSMLDLRASSRPIDGVYAARR